MICPTRSRNHMFASHFGESHESASKKFYAPTIFPLSPNRYLFRALEIKTPPEYILTGFSVIPPGFKPGTF